MLVELSPVEVVPVHGDDLAVGEVEAEERGEGGFPRAWDSRDTDEVRLPLLDELDNLWDL